LDIEQLEHRLAPVVGAFAFAPTVNPGTGYDGVVKIINPTTGGAGSGALLFTGRDILTAAHVVDANGDHIPDQPSYTVQFDMPDG
jgi:hypothetical protein